MNVLKSLLCAYVVLHTVSSMPNLQNEWQEWKQKYGKMYSTDAEEKVHLEVWEENYRYVLEHEAQSDRGFEVEMNGRADQKIGRPPIDVPIHEYTDQVEKDELKFVPQSWDWRPKGAIGPVRNQGQLGDVQSIVASECVQSYAEIKTGKFVDVSAYEVHDCCVKSQIANKDIFQCIHSIGGLCSAASYPKSAGTCRNNTCSSVVQINGGMMVPRGDETALMAAVYNMPVMALVDASHPSFQLYRNGIYTEPRCSSTRLDHALQIVGYGSMSGKDYWICKNSWGASWGEDGYINIARNKDNMCGIATWSEYPV